MPECTHTCAQCMRDCRIPKAIGIEESNHTIRELSKLDANLEQPDGSTYRGAFTELLKQLHAGTQAQVNVDEASTVSKIAVTIHVDRTTKFFVFNYVSSLRHCKPRMEPCALCRHAMHIVTCQSLTCP